MIFSLILLGICLNTAAQLLLKAGTTSVGHFEFSMANIVPIGWAMLTSAPIIMGLSCYVISVVIWLMVLSRVEVSFAYPLVSLGYILNALGAYYFFGESLSLMRVSGIFVIMFGVFLITRSAA